MVLDVQTSTRKGCVRRPFALPCAIVVYLVAQCGTAGFHNPDLWNEKRREQIPMGSNPVL